jgi:hypothetical protein
VEPPSSLSAAAAASSDSSPTHRLLAIKDGRYIADSSSGFIVDPSVNSRAGAMILRFSGCTDSTLALCDLFSTAIVILAWYEGITALTPASDSSLSTTF